MNDKPSDLQRKFSHSIVNDPIFTKLWKYRAFILLHPNQAKPLKDQMLDLALRNKLLGEYQSIYQLFKVSPINIPRTGDYNTFKIEEQNLVNKLKVEAANFQSIGKLEQQIRTYFKLGQIYAQYGDHTESEFYYSKILRKQSDHLFLKDEEYMPQWGKEIFYLITDPAGLSKNEPNNRSYQDLQLFSVRLFQDKKKINSTLAFIRDIYKLSKKGIGRGRTKVLQHILSPNFTVQDIIDNGILSLIDLGFLYSLLALAYKDRKYLKQNVKWSSKIQIAYLHSDYKKLFSEMLKHYDNYGQFNPTILFVYKNCEQQITKKVLCELLNAYHTISYSKIEDITGIKPERVLLLIKQNPNLPYLLDPITQSVIYYQKTIPLYEEATLLLDIIKQKYQQKQKALLLHNVEEMDYRRMDMLQHNTSQTHRRNHDFAGLGSFNLRRYGPS